MLKDVCAPWIALVCGDELAVFAAFRELVEDYPHTDKAKDDPDKEVSNPQTTNHAHPPLITLGNSADGLRISLELNPTAPSGD